MARQGDCADGYTYCGEISGSSVFRWISLLLTTQQSSGSGRRRDSAFRFTDELPAGYERRRRARRSAGQRVLLPLHGPGVLHGVLQDSRGLHWPFTVWDISSAGLCVFSAQPLLAAKGAELVAVLNNSQGQEKQRLRCRLAWLDKERNGYCFLGLQFEQPLAPGSYGARFLAPGLQRHIEPQS